MARVTSISDLEELKRSAAMQGQSIPNYSEWSNILNDLEELNVKSTGSYEGDKALHFQMRKEAETYAIKVQTQQQNQQQVQQEIPEKQSKNDNEQALKSTVANAVSSDIMANYMKVFHLL